MKLAFSAVHSGLGNNGGTRTILKCREALENLGHECDIIATVDNFTWFDHKPAIPFIPDDLDAVIAVACSDVIPTLGMNVPIRAWYIRGHESWAMSEYELSRRYNSGILNIVNSKGLQKRLESFGAKSKVVYQGIDFDWWQDRNLRPKNKIRIGCLYGDKPSKRWSDFVELANILDRKNYEYVSMGNAIPKDDFLIEKIANVDHDKLCDLYSSCHIWFAPTENEGLHNVPLEAGLCGCLIVCAAEPMNGMLYDYALPDTAMIYDRKNIWHAADLIESPDWSCIGRMQKHLIDNIGTREKNMKKMVEHLRST